MRIHRALALAISATLSAIACGQRAHPPPVGSWQDVQPTDGTAANHDAAPDAPACVNDAGASDANAGAYAAVEVPPTSCASCAEMRCPVIDTGCSATELCNDGLDNNCDGRVDEACGCQPGETQRCFQGPPGRRGHGVCADGTQVCQGTGEFGTWSECTGGIAPSAEACDGADNNCDGCPDNAMCCHPDGTCPAADDPRVPVGRPFEVYTLHGADFYSGNAVGYEWRVEGGPCDRLLYATSQAVTFQLRNAGTDPRTATGPDLTFTPTLSGDYTVTFTVQLAGGGTFECTFLIKVRAPGFRAELCWDRNGQTDLDLWVHRPGTTTGWPGGADSTADTCYYANCRNGNALDWGYQPTANGVCNEAAAAGNLCSNPRLDIDNIASAGVPENINVDAPLPGDNFRVAVNYYGGSGPVLPMVNIYCGGTLRGTFGGATVNGVLYGSAPVSGFDTSGGNASGSLWRVADVTMNSATDCTVHPLVTQGTTSACVETGGPRTLDGTSCVRR